MRRAGGGERRVRGDREAAEAPAAVPDRAGIEVDRPGLRGYKHLKVCSGGALRVLGIDPGSRFTGYGVVESRGTALTHVGHGVVCADPKAPLEARLKSIFEALSEAVSKYRPEAVAVEGLFSFRNARSALVLGHARGVALLVAAQTGLPVFEYAPAKVKRAVGAGGADGKDAIARMVRTWLGAGVPLERADASDALAVAICHVNQQRAAFRGSTARRRGALAAFAERLVPSYQSAR